MVINLSARLEEHKGVKWLLRRHGLTLSTEAVGAPSTSTSTAEPEPLAPIAAATDERQTLYYAVCPLPLCRIWCSIRYNEITDDCHSELLIIGILRKISKAEKLSLNHEISP